MCACSSIGPLNLTALQVQSLVALADVNLQYFKFE